MENAITSKVISGRKFNLRLNIFVEMGPNQVPNQWVCNLYPARDIFNLHFICQQAACRSVNPAVMCVQKKAPCISLPHCK